MACYPGVQLLKQPPTPRSWPWPTNSWRAALPGTRASWRRAANSATASRTRTRCCCATAATRRSICTVSSRSWRVYRMETGTAGNVSIKQQVILVHRYFCQVSWWRYRVRRPFKPDHNIIKLFNVAMLDTWDREAGNVLNFLWINITPNQSVRGVWWKPDLLIKS